MQELQNGDGALCDSLAFEHLGTGHDDFTIAVIHESALEVGPNIFFHPKQTAAIYKRASPRVQSLKALTAYCMPSVFSTFLSP